MPTPKQGYFTQDGTQVPGTTTVIGRFKDSGPLIWWAYKQGKEGVPLYKKRDEACDVGTVGHEMAEMRVKGVHLNTIRAYPKKQLPEELVPQAMSAFDAFLQWEKQSKLKILYTEIQLVSERHRYGGTPDAIGLVNGELCLIDFKTSNGVYLDHLIQLAAYRELWNECRPDEQIGPRHHLLRFAKEHGDFAHHYYTDLDDAWQQFLLFRQAYDIDKKLKKRV